MKADNTTGAYRPSWMISSSSATGTLRGIAIRRIICLLLILLLLLVAITNRPVAAAATTTGTSSTSGEEQQQQPKKQKQKESPPDFQSYWELVTWFSKDYDLDGLHQRLKSMFDMSQRSMKPSDRRLPPPVRNRGGGFDATTRHKILHDIEQFQWLATTDKLSIGNPQSQELLKSTLPKLYRSVLERMDRTEYDEETELYEFQQEDKDMIGKYYNRAFFLPEFGMEAVKKAGRHDGNHPVPPLLNPAIDFPKIERQWYGEEDGYDHPGIVVIDNLLSPPVLEKVRDYLLMSTFYYETKTPRYGRYLGAYISDGMHDKLLMAVAFELNKAMPRVMKGHAMKEMWVYKYESSSPDDAAESRTGIHTHADDAAVNVNIWITPDEANLDPTSGGLVVFTARPPDHWSFDEFNSNWEFVEENLLKPTNFANVTVPYRQNRAVLFDSFLFHKTDNCRFRQGYENRRINLTILYGNREKLSGSIREEL